MYTLNILKCDFGQIYNFSSYLQEYAALGTAGGIYHFRDQIQSGDPEAFFLINGDVCGDFPLIEMTKFHEKNKNSLITILGTEVLFVAGLILFCQNTFILIFI